MVDLSKAARNQRMEAAHNDGATIAVLAAEFGLSETRVRTILVNLKRARMAMKKRLETPLRRVR